MTRILGIDPGISGALALLVHGELEHVADMPTVARQHGKGQSVEPVSLANIIANMAPDLLIIEQVAAMPGQGVSSTFKFGEAFGITLGIAGAFKLPVTRIRPNEWKKRAGLLRKPKDTARALATERWPSMAAQFARKRDCGRADAALIALHESGMP